MVNGWVMGNERKRRKKEIGVIICGLNIGMVLMNGMGLGVGRLRL